MKQIFFLSIILFQFQSRCLSQDQDKGKILSDYLLKEMNEQKIPGLQVAVIKNNEIIFSESFGYANVPFSVNANERTIFSINSIAKVFAATAVMQLTEENKVDIGDSISKHLDGLPKDWGKITIKTAAQPHFWTSRYRRPCERRIGWRKRTGLCMDFCAENAFAIQSG